MSSKKSPTHYVDNQKFLQTLIAYRSDLDKAKKSKTEPPPIPDYLGECFLKIANHLSYRPNFARYTFREDMVSDGIENCLVYMNNFNPTKSANPFGYFTTIIYYAFIRRIMREKKHTYIKYKLINKAIIDGDTKFDGHDIHIDADILKYDNVKEFIQQYESHTLQRRNKRKAKSQDDELDLTDVNTDFIEDVAPEEV